VCELCQTEHDDDYEGDSIEAKRRKAVKSVVRRHPELGLEPDDITLRFAPRTELTCVRVNIGAPESVPTYEIHKPLSMSRGMIDSPPIAGIAKAAWIGSQHSYPEICEILGISQYTPYDALFVSADPPVDTIRSEAGTGVHQYEQDIQADLGLDDN